MSVVKRDDNMMYYTSLLQLLGISWFMSCMLISLITTIIPVEAKGSNKDPLGPLMETWLSRLVVGSESFKAQTVAG